MRDIRDELKERLSEATAKRQKHAAMAKEAEVEEISIHRMLEIEERRFSKPGDRPAAPWTLSLDGGTPVENPYVDFLKSALADGKPHSLEHLALSASVAGINVGKSKSVKRVLNATLLGLMNRKVTKRTPEGKWELLKQEAPPAKTDEASQ